MSKKNKILPYLPTSIQNVIIQYCYLPPKYIDELKKRTFRLFNFLNSWYPTDSIAIRFLSDKYITYHHDFSYDIFNLNICKIEKYWYIKSYIIIDSIKDKLICALSERNIKRREINNLVPNYIFNECYMGW